MHCFIGEVECPRDTLVWLTAIEPHLSDDEHHTHQSANFAFRASLLNVKLKNTLASNGDIFRSTLEGFIWELEQLEEEITSDMACTSIDNSVDLAAVNRHNYHRSFRMILRWRLWELLNATTLSLEPSLDPLIREGQSDMCVDLIREWSDEVLETIPYVLGSGPPRTLAAPDQAGIPCSRPSKFHDAMSLAYPLRLVAWVRLSSGDQKSAARAGLGRIASEYYIMHAINFTQVDSHGAGKR